MRNAFQSDRKVKQYWGPDDRLSSLLGENYQEYSKNEKIGKVADWLNTGDKKGLKSTNSNMPTSMYSYTIEEEDEFAEIVASKSHRNTFNRNRDKFALNWNKQINKVRLHTPRNNYPQRRRGTQHGRWRQGERYSNVNYWFRKPSVMVRDTWKLIEDVQYTQLQKLRMADVPKVVDLYSAGTIFEYDRRYDYVRPREPLALKLCDCIFHKVPTCDDPIIRSHLEHATVFASDSIIATLMTCTRSVAPWDIVIHRVANLLFFDKRPDSDIELLTVSENAADPGFDTQINSPPSLSLEATSICHNYSQQCLLPNTQRKLKHPNPFFETSSSQMPSVGYKYRVFDLGDGIKVMIRCEYDAYSKEHGNINIKTLLEWGTKPNMFNWREEFETQSGSILAMEIKNNGTNFAKWTTSAILAGDNTLKIGFVSRNQFNNNKNHTIIGSINVKSRDLSNQIGLNMLNAWGIIYTLSKRFLSLPEGKYVLMKDPHKSAVRIYNVPENTAESDIESDQSDENDSQNKDGFIDTFEEFY